MSDLFSTPASHALDHPELDPSILQPTAGPSSMGDANASLTLEEAFEVDDTVQRILAGGYKTIALQFPDELLPSSVGVFKSIQRRISHTGAQAYILADSTYGSCCPDILSCMHLPADFLVHYGHACLTPTDALPVHYVFPRRKVDVRKAVEDLLDASQCDLEGKKGVMVVWDVAFDWLADDIVSTFSSIIPLPTSFATIQRSSTSPSPVSDRAGEKSSALRSIEPPDGVELKDCLLFYIGDGGRALMNLQMTHAGNPLYAYIPSSCSVKAMHPATSLLLQRRLFALHNAMSSDIFGLVVSNIGLTSSIPLLAQLRKDLTRHRKKWYTLSVGRLNPAKLANFDAIECFVLVGCQEGGIVDNAKDFLRPIVTPWELELALRGSEAGWTSEKWTLDMGKVLQEAQEREGNTIATANGNGHENGSDRGDGEDDAPNFSLVTGKYRSRKTFGRPQEVSTAIEGVQSLTIRNKEFSLAKLESAGSNYLSSREFKGLDPRYGMDEPATLEQGRSGIARGYEAEG